MVAEPPAQDDQEVLIVIVEVSGRWRRGGGSRGRRGFDGFDGSRLHHHLCWLLVFLSLKIYLIFLLHIIGKRNRINFEIPTF